MFISYSLLSVPVDPLEWQISQDTANAIVACLVNTVGAAESVLRVAATGHDKRLFFKVILCLYGLSALGRLAFGITIAYTGSFLPTFSLHFFHFHSHSQLNFNNYLSLLSSHIIFAFYFEFNC